MMETKFAVCETLKQPYLGTLQVKATVISDFDLNYPDVLYLSKK